MHIIATINKAKTLKRSPYVPLIFMIRQLSNWMPTLQMIVNNDNDKSRETK